MVSKDQVSHWIRLGFPKLLAADRQKSNDHDNDVIINEIISNYSKLVTVKTLCSLWSGMGHIYHIKIQHPGKAMKSYYDLVVKYVSPGRNRSSTNASFGDRRKAISYQVECNFYDKLAYPLKTLHGVELPTPYFVERGNGNDDDDDDSNGQITIGMSLVNGNYCDGSNLDHVHAVLSWLAKFHAAYWEGSRTATIDDESDDCTNTSDVVDKEFFTDTIGVQEIGSYWHLLTRPEEHECMSKNGWEGRLKLAAKSLDSCLKRDTIMQCLIHGDVKDANILIKNKGGDDSCTALLYDFQYCGRGTPTQDIAYFFCSSVDLDTLNEDELLKYYHTTLVERLKSKKDQKQIQIPTLDHLRKSLDIAYCDYCRFMCGWGFWGSSSSHISSRVQNVLNDLDNGKKFKSEEEYDNVIREKYW